MGYKFTFGGEIYQEDDNEYLIEIEPETFDVCDPELTNYPKEAFLMTPCKLYVVDFIKENLPTIGALLDGERTIIPLSSVIDEINNLKPEAPEGEERPELYKDRVRWFQYWANKCIRLYGDEAKFSVS